MFKIVKRRTPTGRIVLVRGRKRPRIAICARCKKPLHGVPIKIPSEIRRLSKSKRRPSRPFGGYLCSSCAREYFREKARKIGG
ncbi:MAG: 50S ribosomal protein L34e [Candidatus Aenigmarchaeota archaeon]|nr:50S ribosomal protein L34e [Candidatus Aenigmarchaeota archaeon]